MEKVIFSVKVEWQNGFGKKLKYTVNIRISYVMCHPIQHPTHLQTSMTLPTRPYAIFSTLQGTQNPDTKPTLQRAKNANTQATHLGVQNANHLNLKYYQKQLH